MLAGGGQSSLTDQERGQASYGGRIAGSGRERFAETAFRVIDPSKNFMPLCKKQLPLGRGELLSPLVHRVFGSPSVARRDLREEQRHPSFRPVRIDVDSLLKHLERPIGLASPGEQLSEPDEIARTVFSVAGQGPLRHRDGVVELARPHIDLRGHAFQTTQTVRADHREGLLRLLETIGEVEQRDELADHRRVCRAQLGSLLQSLDRGRDVAAEDRDLGEKLLDLRPAGPVVLGFDEKILGGVQLFVFSGRQNGRFGAVRRDGCRGEGRRL